MKASSNIPKPVRVVVVEMSEPEAIVLKDCIGNSSPDTRKKFFDSHTEVDGTCVFSSLYSALDSVLSRDDEQ